MKIDFNYSGKNLMLVYNDNGTLEYIINAETNEKMIIEYTQVGIGYEITKNNGYIPMSMCNAIYVRIMDLNVFVPKYIFILNNELKE